MTTIYKVILLISFLFLAASTSVPVHAADRTYGDLGPVDYVRNYDGDTITFNIPGVHPVIGNLISVRVYGIDTPEIRGKCTKEKQLARGAKATAKGILQGAQTITLKNISRGKYFRIVADVVADGVNVGEVLISQRLAVPYFGGKKLEKWCM